MPITITTPPPHSIIGPGLTIQWESDFTGPMPTGSTWLFEVTADAEATQGVETWTLPFDSTATNLTMGEPSTGFRSKGGYILQTGDTAYLQITLRNDVLAVIDSGTATPHWDASAGLGYQAEDLITHISGGFTSTDRTRLIDTQTNVAGVVTSTASILDGITSTITTSAGDVATTLGQIFSGKTLDLITLNELTTGPTGSPVSVEFGGFFFGVIVRLTTIPEWLTPATPDNEWYYPDLAVCRVFRGSDLEFRAGIHTPTWMKPRPWEFGSTILNETTLFGTPPDITIHVDFAFGVEGQVYLMRLP